MKNIPVSDIVYSVAALFILFGAVYLFGDIAEEKIQEFNEWRYNLR